MIYSNKGKECTLTIPSLVRIFWFWWWVEILHLEGLVPVR
jgi:hypothetical protein